MQGLDSPSIFQIQKQNFFNMLEFSNCDRNSLKPFINILRTYGSNRQKENNIGVLENYILET